MYIWEHDLSCSASDLINSIGSPKYLVTNISHIMHHNGDLFKVSYFVHLVFNATLLILYCIQVPTHGYIILSTLVLSIYQFTVIYHIYQLGL